MQLEDAPATYFFKLIPWFEANKIRLAWGGGIIIVACGLIYFHSWQRDQRELTAGQALTQSMMSDPRGSSVDQQVANFSKIARDYPGTDAGQRAALQSAALLFEAGKYPDAQSQFQQFLGQYPDSYFAAQAALGAAACLDAQGKADLAAAACQRVINTYSDAIVVGYAKFSLAQIDERQGKLTDALSLYEEVARTNPNSSLGSDAGLRAMELKMKPSSATPAATPATPPFQLNH